MPSPPTTVAQSWRRTTIAFFLMQGFVVVLGILLFAYGRDLAPEATRRVEAMRQVIHAVVALGVVALVAFARSRLHPENVREASTFLRDHAIALGIGELTIVLALVGLSRFHLDEFLIGAALVFIAEIFILIPAGKKILALPAEQKVKRRGNKSRGAVN